MHGNRLIQLSCRRADKTSTKNRAKNKALRRRMRQKDCGRVRVGRKTRPSTDYSDVSCEPARAGFRTPPEVVMTIQQTTCEKRDRKLNTGERRSQAHHLHYFDSKPSQKLARASSVFRIRTGLRAINLHDGYQKETPCRDSGADVSEFV